jgi:chitodextrinase
MIAAPGRTPSARPRAAITLLITAAFLALLAPGGAAATSPRTFEGRLVMAHGDDFTGLGKGHATYDYSLVTSSGTYTLTFPGKAPSAFLNGAEVKVRGTAQGQTVAVGASSADTSVTTAASSGTSSTKRVLLLLVNFTTNTSQPWSTSTATGIMFTNANSVANYFAEESYGALTMTGDVFGYVTISFDTTGCNYSDLASKANSAATAAGVVLSNYTNIQYAFPSLGACGWSGLAYMPGTQTWINGALGLRVASHELSHNFGVHHASTYNCVDNGVRVALSATASNCTASEYGDPFSVMGAASNRHTSCQELYQMKFFGSAETTTVTTAGTYTVGAADDPSSPLKCLRVSRGNGTYIYMELREPYGAYFDNFSPTDPVVNGASLRLASDWTTITQTKLIDTTPATSSYNDAALAVGSSFTDPLTGMTVTTVSLDASGVTVSISWGTGQDTQAPTTPSNVTATMTGSTTDQVSWTASTDNVSVAGYRVSRDGSSLGTTTGTTFNDSGLVAGSSYTYSVVAYDAAGNTSGSASVSITVSQPDTTAPTSPSNLATTSVTKARVAFSWTGSTDNVGVAGYRIYRNGALLATTSNLTWTDAHQRSSATYYVVAFDAAGNVSTASNSVTVAAR